MTSINSRRPTNAIQPLAAFVVAVTLSCAATGAFGQEARIGTSLPVSSPVPVSRFPDISYDSGHDAYLVAWGRISTAIYARFISGDGVALPAGSATPATVSTIPPSGATGVACAPQINACLVAWIQNSPWAVMGRLVRYNANAVGYVEMLGAPFVINQNGSPKSEEGDPAVAYSPTSNEFIVAWGEGLNVLAQRVTGGGSVSGGVISVAATGLWEGLAAVTYNSAQNEYAIAYYYETTSGTNCIGVQRVSAGTGALPSGRSTVISGGFNQYPEIAYSPVTNQYLVITWSFSGPDAMIRGQMVSAAGEPIGLSFPVAALGLGDGIGLGYNAGGDRFFSAYLSLYNDEIWGVGLSSSGAPSTQFQVTNSVDDITSATPCGERTPCVQPAVAGSTIANKSLVVTSLHFSLIMGQLVGTGGTIPPPSCAVTASASAPSIVSQGDGVSFTASASPTNCGAATPTYSWNFGDGQTSSAQNPTHVYTSDGTFNWVMTVEVGTATATKTGTIRVLAPGVCLPTTATITAKPPTSLAAMWQDTGVNVTSGQLVTVSVEGAQSWVNGGQSWTAAGNAADRTGPANSPMPGAPRMALVGRIGTAGAPFVVGVFGQITANATGKLYLAPNDDWYLLWDNSGTLTASICVGGAACTVNATATVPGVAAAGSSVAMAGTCSLSGCGGASATYAWTFGDGQTSSAQNPTHTYANAGTYNWSLTVSAGSITNTKSGSIQVVAAGDCVPTTSVITAAPPQDLAQMWQNTGASVSAGQRLTISVANGQAWTNAGQSWTAAGNSADPTVLTNSPMPGAPRMALVGRIGTTGTPFLVGTWMQVTPTVSGTLYLAPNDDWYQLWDNSGSISVLTCVGGAACAVNATPTVPATAAPGESVTFQGSCSATGCGLAAPSYLWDFGDGETTTTQSPAHVYAAAGSYTWTLTVQVAGASSSTSGAITVRVPTCTPTTATITAQPPTSLAAMWQATGASVTAGQGVTITVSGSQTWVNAGRAWTAAGNPSDPTLLTNSPMPGAPRMALVGRIGTTGQPFLVGTSAQFTATASGQLYLAPNDDWYQLWDNSGSLSVSVCVGAAACTVEATATVPTSSVVGNAVPFIAAGAPSGCGSASVSYTWDFGDGATSSTQSPSHTYTTAGSYTWTLTVQAGTATTTKTGTVTVRESGACTSSTFSVTARPPTSLAAMWQGTGVQLAAGNAVTITVEGSQTWTNAGRAWTAAGNAADPTVLTNSPMPGAARMALVGRIGTAGQPFLVGTSKQVASAPAGQLFLAPNDDWYQLWDNSGSLTVTICK